MMATLWSNLRFELTSRKRFLSPYIYWLVLTLLVFLMVLATGGAFKGTTINFGLGQKVFINSPYAINLYSALISLFGILIISPIFGQAVCKDYEAKFDQIVLATPAHRTGFYLGRFLGATIVCILIFSGLALGQYLAAALPFVQRSLFTAPRLSAYLVPYFSVLIPNIIIFGSVAFAVGSITKKMSAVYIAGILCFMGYLFGIGLSSDIERKVLRALIDPFGLNAMMSLTEYWSVAEMNSRLVTLKGIFLWNRVLWLTVSLGFLALALTFVQRAPKPSKKKKSEKATDEAGDEVEKKKAQGAASNLLPNVPLDFSGAARFRLFVKQTLFEAKSSLKNIYFICLTLAGVIYMFALNGQVGGKIFGTETYPTTYKVLELSSGSFSIFLLIIMTFYTGELLWRERQSRTDQILDAMPVPLWLNSMAKFAAMQIIIASLLLIVGLCGVIIQLAHGYTRLELDQVFTTLYSIQFVSFLILSAMMFTIHTLVNNKYIGHGLFVLYTIVMIYLGNAGFDHVLYRYGSGLGGARYSDMNGYGPFLLKIRNMQLYWLFGAALLLTLVYLFWVRGTDNAWSRRCAEARKRLTRPLQIFVALVLVGFIAQGSHIYYNTNIVNEYKTEKQGEKDRLAYEQTYKAKYDQKPQLKLAKVKAAVDIFPSRLWLKSKVEFTFDNKNSGPVDEILVNLPVKKKFVNLEFDRPTEIVVDDERMDLQILRFKTPVAPGEQVHLVYSIDYGYEGFRNDSTPTAIAANGTFFNNQSYFPSFGYQDGAELGSDKLREQYGLKPKLRMPPITDEAAKQVTYVTGLDADWIDFETTVSTDNGQVAIAPGYLQKDWVDGDRHYFQYAMDQKILNFYSFMSAKYEVKRDSWNDVKIEVYYQKGHEYNLDTMIDAVKQGLAYYSENFGPYQHRQFRILEFPRYATFAQSFPNTIPYSEAIGFIAKVDPKDEEDLDYPFYVTAHELAHQWWAHQVIGANVQGATMLSESLAQYSALMVMEKKYGRAKMSRFLKHEMNEYLQSRSSEDKKELPLYLNENQQYLHYAKGSVVMFALKEVVGEKALNHAIRVFADKVRYQNAPFTTATEFVATLKADLDPKFHDVIDDLLTRITLCDNRIQEHSVKAEADGTYTIDLDILGKKVYIDDKGDENEAPLARDFEFTVKDEEGKVMLTQNYPIKTGQNHLTIKVPKKPKVLWLDELGIWIDKNRDDNKITL